MRGLALAKVYHPNIDPAPLMKGFPEFNTNGTPFDKRCFYRVTKQTHHVATEIARSLKLASIQNGYNAKNEGIFEEEPPRIHLLQNFGKAKGSCSSAAQAGPSGPSDPADEEENIFESLVAVTWKPDAAGKEPAQGRETDPTNTQSSSARADDPARPAA